jgi:hypothetical protein
VRGERGEKVRVKEKLGHEPGFKLNAFKVSSHDVRAGNFEFRKK